jgi:pilus assembly protein CpaB
MALAIVFALIAAILIFAVLSSSDNGNKTATPAANTVNVVAAADDISARTTLSSDMLEIVAVPADQALSGSYSDVANLAGLTTRYPLSKGEQVTAGKIGETQKDDKSLARVVPAGKRAIAIAARQESIVAGLILPGDLVDVIAVFSASSSSSEKAVTILQNVEVLAVGETAQEPIPPPENAGDSTPDSVRLGQTPGDAKPQPDAATVTVAVTPEQAQIVALTQETANLWLSLRPRGQEPAAKLGESDLSQFGVGP